MQILFIHSTFPAQFGPVLEKLAGRDDVECIFVTKATSGMQQGVRCLRFEAKGGATASTHYCSRTFENQIWHAHSVYEVCKAHPDLQPDLIVGHSGFGSTIFLPELYSCPIINLFEYYYHGHDSDLDFRSWNPPELNVLRSRARNAMILLDLQNCTRGYTATEFQWGLFPENWQSKIEVIHDGIDTAFWRRRSGLRKLRDEAIAEDTRVVTYVARGLESMRGFDIFVRVANRIAAEMPNVIFVVVGSDRIHYGNDETQIKTKTYREHVILQEKPDLSRFRFVGTVPKSELVEILSLGDVHIYLTAPFVLSWSVLNAMSCECVVVGSDTAPVREVIRHEENGLLAGFFDVEGLANQALRVLKQPDEYRALAMNGRATIAERFDVNVVFPRIWDLYLRTIRDAAR